MPTPPVAELPSFLLQELNDSADIGNLVFLICSYILSTETLNNLIFILNIMKSFFLVFTLAVGSLSAVLERAACNADNCARAVTGTRYSSAVQASHTADCSSFMVRTVTPATSYVASILPQAI